MVWFEDVYQAVSEGPRGARGSLMTPAVDVAAGQEAAASVKADQARVLAELGAPTLLASSALTDAAVAYVLSSYLPIREPRGSSTAGF